MIYLLLSGEYSLIKWISREKFIYTAVDNQMCFFLSSWLESALLKYRLLGENFEGYKLQYRIAGMKCNTCTRSLHPSPLKCIDDGPLGRLPYAPGSANINEYTFTNNSYDILKRSRAGLGDNGTFSWCSYDSFIENMKIKYYAGHNRFTSHHIYLHFNPHTAPTCIAVVLPIWMHQCSDGKYKANGGVAILNAIHPAAALRYERNIDTILSFLPHSAWCMRFQTLPSRVFLSSAEPE